MNGVTKAMGAMNKKLNLPAISKIMKEFERENDKMEMTTEIMGDALDDAFENEGEEDESEELVNAVLDELGCSMNADLVSVPIGGNKGSNGAIAANKSAAAAVEENSREKEQVLEGGGGVSGGIDDDLQARLDNLRK